MAIINATPASNLQALVNGLNPGDELVLGDGVYTQGSIDINVSGTATNPIIIRAANPLGAVISGSNYTNPAPNQFPAQHPNVSCTIEPYTSAGLFHIDGDYIHVHDLEFTQSAGDAIRMIDGGSAVTGAPHTGCVISGCDIHHNRRSAIRTGGHSDLLVEGNKIYRNVTFCECFRSPSDQNWPHAVNLKHGSGIVFRDNIVHSNWGEGVGFTDTDDPIFEDNIAFDNYALNLYTHYARNHIVRRNVFGWSVSTEFDRGSEPPAFWVINMEGNFSCGAGASPCYDVHTNILGENNLFVGRGERAISFGGNNNENITDLVTVRNNTVYMQHQGDGARGLIASAGNFANYNTVNFYNNIVHATNGGPIYSLSDSQATGRFNGSNNLWSNTPSSSGQGPGDVTGAPSLVAPSTSFTVAQLENFDRSAFNQLASSLSVDAGSTALGASEDYTLAARPISTSTDIGFHEFGAVVDPVIDIIDQGFNAGDVVNYTPTFTNPNSSALQFTASNLPPGLTINPTAGEITGTVTAAGTYNIQICLTEI